MASTARDRAEDLLHNLQKKARELMDAEEGLVRTLRDVVEQKALSPGEARKRLEEAVGRIKANAVWERLRKSEAASTLSEYRSGLERRVDDSVQRLLSTLQIVSKGDLEKVEDEVVSLRKKVESLRKKVKTPQPEA